MSALSNSSTVVEEKQQKNLPQLTIIRQKVSKSARKSHRLNHTPVSHAVIGREHVRRFPVIVKHFLKHVRHTFNACVDQFYVLQILTAHIQDRKHTRNG